MKKKIYLLLIVVLTSCEGFLDEKPNRNLAVPASLDEIEALLNHTSVFFLTPTYQLIASDEYFLTDAGFNGLNNFTQQRAHLRDFETMFEGVSNVAEWSTPYSQIMYSNIVLDLLDSQTDLTNSEKQKADRIIGAAMFKRAFALFNLILNHGEFPDPISAASKNGIPVPLVPDIANPAPFANLSDTYLQIINDLENSAGLMQERPTNISTPSSQSAFALLARVYLSMNDFENALKYSEKALQMGYRLMDYNDKDPGLAFPFEMENEEVIYYSVVMFYSGFVNSPETRVDPVFFNNIPENDLRKNLFFRTNPNGAINFRGTYSGNRDYFSGLTTSELFLIKAECHARLSEEVAALESLNELMQMRFDRDTFMPLTGETAEEVLSFVLEERKKELFFRGIRWSDLKRFHQLGELEIQLIREVNGTSYAFQPSSTGFGIPIPPEELNLRNE
ncbi:RagB/SusD family nutrient uptake outer membrane protein [Fontibacter flavus]|uniref:RagB/SusD family nutrient uptake outer membrane protein n=1 Tax=Fontibacter flavus TaxID=654838 RepID=A0ABV6FX01_9BACT